MMEEEIPAFVQALLAIGCNICAVGHRHYCLGDADLSAEECERVLPQLNRIESAFGMRDHLRLEIVAYLRKIGRYIEVEPPSLH